MIDNAVILAGGLATRMRPLTETCPKVMLDVNGEPFIAHQLRLLRKAGITKVVLCLGYLGEEVQAYVRQGEAFDMTVECVFDGDTLLGTGGAIKKALPFLSEHFFTIYGDSYLTCDYQAVAKAFLAAGRLGLMTVFCNDGQWDTSNVEFAGNSIKAYDKCNVTPKMHHIDYGLGIFSAGAFDFFAYDVPGDLSALYQHLLRQGQLAAYEVHERFYEIGSFDGLAELRTLLKDGSEA